MENHPVVLDGHYKVDQRVLIITGPAAQALWTQLKDTPLNVSRGGGEFQGRVKTSAGTTCRESYYRPRPLAHSVPFYECEISQALVGE